MGVVAGKVMPLPKGPYNPSVVYKILDVVSNNNKLWICKKPILQGAEPLQNDENWMLAIDGVTDVKNLDEKVEQKMAVFEANMSTAQTDINSLESQMSTANNNISNLASDVNSVGTRCSALEGKVVIDDVPTPGSFNLFTCNGAYNMLHRKYNRDETNGDYEHFDHYYSLGNQLQRLYSSNEQRIDLGNSGLLHQKMTGYVGSDMGHVTLYSSSESLSDHTATGYSENGSSLSVSGQSITFHAHNSTDSGYLMMYPTSLFSQTDSAYNLGSNSYRFKDIYASNSVIQTSDENEKKDITELESETVKNIVMGLRPVSFKFINGSSDRTHYGLVAQDVEKLVNSLGIGNQHFAPLIKGEKTEMDDEGHIKTISGEYVYGLRYSEFVGILVKMCQNLQNEVDELKVEVSALKSNS